MLDSGYLMLDTELVLWDAAFGGPHAEHSTR